jgi:hypothetical protein
MKNKAALSLCISLFLLVAGDAGAGEFEWGKADNKRFRASLGAYWPEVETTLRVDDPDLGASGIGTKISAEDDLGLSDRETLPWLDMRIRLARRHLIDITYYDLSRSGSRTLDVEITVEGETFSASTEVDSFFDSTIWRVAYGYSFLNDNKRELGLLVGLHVTEIEVGVNSADGTQTSEASGTAPLPSFGIHGSLELPKRWRFRGWGQVFALELDEYEGSLLNVSAVLEHDTFKNVGFGFGWSYFGFDLEADAEDLSGDFDYNFQGPNAYVNFMF